MVEKAQATERVKSIQDFVYILSPACEQQRSDAEHQGRQKFTPANLMGLLVSGTYLAIPCQVDVTVGCILADICKTGKFMCPCSMLAVLAIFPIW